MSEAALKQAQQSYRTLYAAALPGAGGITPDRLEIATFNCSETFAEFQRIGLGLETVVIYRAPDDTGHTGKVLMNLPGQLLLEHGHVDTFVLEKDAPLPNGFVRLAELINAFEGILQYHGDGTPKRENGTPQYIYRDADYQIVQAEDGRAALPDGQPGLVAVYPGKSETFKAIYGDGILFADTAEVLYAPEGVDPHSIPGELLPLAGKVREQQAITTQRMIYMTRGMNVLLSKNTRHAFLGGLSGCVYLEFSTPSMDEADRFTDPRVIR
ncbi:MAG: hypothetical protein JW951_05395 [Lentisphaerae bacterium]|nr:hypothetical protein [Lentisphaerota bacterium]